MNRRLIVPGRGSGKLIRNGWKPGGHLPSPSGMGSFLSRLSLRKLPGLAHFFYVQRIRGFDQPGQPLLDDDSVAWLAERLKSTRLYLEFGSGGSTLLANRLGIPSITVESDRFYAAAVRRALPSPEKAKILTPDMGLTGPWGMPIFSRERKGPRYVGAPFGLLGDRFPDLIFVDGRYRVACVLESARQAAAAKATATVLLDDYVGRSSYHVLERHLGKAELIGRAAAFVIGQASVSRDDLCFHLSDPS